MKLSRIKQGVEITLNEDISDAELDAYILYVKKKNAGKILERMELDIQGDEVSIQCSFKPVPFEKIRRITGYLVGTLERFNDAKAAEEHDRVKHTEIE